MSFIFSSQFSSTKSLQIISNECVKTVKVWKTVSLSCQSLKILFVLANIRFNLTRYTRIHAYTYTQTNVFFFSWWNPSNQTFFLRNFFFGKHKLFTCHHSPNSQSKSNIIITIMVILINCFSIRKYFANYMYKVYRSSWLKINTTLIVAVMFERLRRWTGNQLCSVHTGSNPVHIENRIESGQCQWGCPFCCSCIGQKCILNYSFQFCKKTIYMETTFDSSLALSM